jgi:hypothetical protein
MEINGKLIIIGVYTTDIGIINDVHTSPQMLFHFSASCDVTDMFKSLKFQVTLPGGSPVSTDVVLPNDPTPPPPDRTRFTARGTVNISPAVLRPGKILAEVIHESGEIPVPAAWITKIPSPPNPSS